MIDRRVRLRPKDAAANYVYGDSGNIGNGILSILRETNGMVWNITPIITENRVANYDVEQPIHTNAGYNNYKNTSNATFNVQGTFYANTGKEALYLLACMIFLRAMTMMDFGRQAAEAQVPDFAVAGAPPPILLFSAYGKYMFNDIPVILKTVNFNFSDEVDYVQVPLSADSAKMNINATEIRRFYQQIRQAGGSTNPENDVYVPQKITISITLEEQPTPDFMSKKFNLNSFKRGELIRKGGFL